MDLTPHWSNPVEQPLKMSSLAGALDSSLVKSSHLTVEAHGHVEDDEMSLPEEQTLDQEQDEEMADLFGQDEDEGVPEDADSDEDIQSPTSRGGSDRHLSLEHDKHDPLEYAEYDTPNEIEVKEAPVSFPNIPVPRSSDGDTWVIRMPNFIKVDSKPFHPETYIGPEHEDEEGHTTESVRERSMSIKLKVENTMRWRWVKGAAGIDIRQSNSRIIHWSDGTLSLRLGKELFDITQTIDNSGAVQRTAFGGAQPDINSQSQPQSQPLVPGAKAQGLTYLVAQHKRSQVLQAEAVIRGYMSLRPTGMQSETHRMLVKAVGQKHNKVARLLMAPDPTVDPEREKLELLKLSAKKTKRKSDASGFGSSRKRRSGRKHVDTTWSDDDEDEFVGIPGGSDEEEDGIPGSAKKKKRDNDRRTEDYQEDDFVVADSDEDEGKGRKHRDHDDDDDELDKLDAQISAQENATKRGKKHNDDVDNDLEMDVESEEDEEEHKVRVAPKGKRTAAVHIDDDDEDDD